MPVEGAAVAAIDKVDEYLDTLSLSTSTRASYRSCLTRFLKWARSKSYYTVSTAARYYLAHMRTYGKQKEGTIVGYSRIVRAFAKWYEDSKTVSIYDMSTECIRDGGLICPPVKVSAGDLRFICRYAKQRGESGLRGRAMLMLAVVCGLSPEQIAGIMPSDVTFAEDCASIRVPGNGGDRVIEFDIPDSVRRAISDYLIERGPVDKGLPLVAVTTTKSKRRAMQAADVRKCLIRMIDVLGYEYGDVLNGDCQRSIAAYIGDMDGTSLHELSIHAAILYYRDKDVG